MCWLEHPMWFWALFKLLSLSITGITQKRGSSGLFGSKTSPKGLFAEQHQEVLWKGLTPVLSQGSASPIPTGAPLQCTGWAEGSRRAKHLLKEKLVPCLVFPVFELNPKFKPIWLLREINLPHWNPCCFVTLKAYIDSSTEKQKKQPDFYRCRATEVPSPLQHKREVLFTNLHKPVQQWAGVKSHPFIPMGRDLPVPQICSEGLEKGQTVLSSCGNGDTSGAPALDSFIWDSQDERGVTFALAPLLRIWR